jgi:hopene-associated glycosyltransferase HpnB
MPDIITFLAAASCLAWFWLLLFHDNFWRADQRLRENSGALAQWPEVAVVIPARNEADVIAETIGSLVVQDYPGEFRIILVDDHSEDGTGAVARPLAGAERLHIIQAPPLQPGWTGKLGAMAHGAICAAEILPDHRYLLFTDADIAHPRDALRRLVLKAETDPRDLVSLMVRLHCRSFWERLLVPAFVFFFQKLYPFPAVNDDQSKTAAAAGGVMLVRREVLQRSVGLAAIRDRLIDDCALASLIQENKGRLWLGLAEETRSVRPYRGLGEIWDMVARTAYTQLNYSLIGLAGAIAGMSVIYLAGPVVFLTYSWHSLGLASSLGLLSWLLMGSAYLPTIIYYRQTPLFAALLPIVGLLYTMMTVSSAWRHWQRRGGAWKGRTY